MILFLPQISKCICTLMTQHYIPLHFCPPPLRQHCQMCLRPHYYIIIILAPSLIYFPEPRFVILNHYGCQTIRFKFKTFSQLLLYHNCDVSRRLKKRNKRNNFLKVFVRSNMATRPCDPLIIGEIPGMPKACEHVGEVSLWSVRPVWRGFLKFILQKKSELPNHVTYDVRGGELFDPMDRQS